MNVRGDDRKDGWDDKIFQRALFSMDQARSNRKMFKRLFNL